MMKCNSCNMEWIDNERFANIKKCPFCGKSLFLDVTRKNYSTMGDVLKEILEMHGENIFSDKTRVLNIFRDLAPHLQKESVMLESAMGNHIERYFIGVNQGERDLNIKRIRSDMSYFMSLEAIEAVIIAFSKAFGWQYISKNVEILIEGAKNNDSDMQLLLGHMYLVGEGGLQKNKEEGEKWLKKASDLGNSVAGNMLQLYNDLEKYSEPAVYKYVLEAAENNDANCQTLIGLMYFHGIGVVRDNDEAIKWLRKAENLGCEEATVFIGLISGVEETLKGIY